ncbi:MAG: hypothetical protein HZA79_08730 [Sphingobacteriales bacterium]|nr:hypothetical protein [Sphingobacteriales bacterium]
MKKTGIALFALLLSQLLPAQFVATMEIKDNDSIQGLCNRKQVYSLFPMFKGQEAAKCDIADETIEDRLNAEVVYLKENPKQNDKGMVSIIINCKGEVVRCETDNKTKSEELDKQILAVFTSLKKWKPGKLNGKEVDSVTLWSFEIKKGKLELH